MYQLHALLDSLFIHGDEVVMAFGKGFPQTFNDILQCHHGFDFQQSAQHNHVECLGVVHLVGCIHGINAVDVDVLACGWIDDAVSVVDKYAARLYFAFKLFYLTIVFWLLVCFYPPP